MPRPWRPATRNRDEDERNLAAGRRLIEMALAVDAVFAGDLARACGPRIWPAVRETVGGRLRALYASPVDGFRRYALAAMLATGSDEFQDVVAPLLSSNDQQVRLRTYRLSSDINPSTLGINWRERVSGWGEESRAEFVSELLHNGLQPDVAAFAAGDESAAVKKAAASSLMWNASDDALIRVLESMDAATFEATVREHPDRIPAALHAKTVAALKHFIESTQDQPARLRAALNLIELGETGLDGVLKDALEKLPTGDMRNLGPYYIEPALEHLRRTDPAWVSEWVAVLIAENVLYSHEYWMKFVTALPDGVVEKYLQRLETEDLSKKHIGGMIGAVAAGANVTLARRLFSRILGLRRQIDKTPDKPLELERQLMRQLEEVFRELPDDIQAQGVLESVHDGDVDDVTVASSLLSRAMRSDVRPLQLMGELKDRMRSYLKQHLNVVLARDDFNGEEKADFASALSQVGLPEDMVDLQRLIKADIERMHRGRAAHAAGDRGPRGNGGNMSYANWHIAAVMQLDPRGADQILIDLLSEPDYTWMVADRVAREFQPKADRAFDRTFAYEWMWAVRDGRAPAPADGERRQPFAAALNAEIQRLLDERAGAKLVRPIDFTLGELAKALATVDPKGSADTVLKIIELTRESNEYKSVEAAERLLLGGNVLPKAVVFAILDSLVARTGKWMQDSDKGLLKHILVLCAFVDDPTAGIARIRQVLSEKKLWGYELRELVTALGESRSAAALDLLYELACDPQTFEHCEDNFINAFAALDTPRARDLVLGFVDPDLPANNLKLKQRPFRGDVLVARLVDLAKREPKVADRLRQLCQRDLPDTNRYILSMVMNWLGRPEDLAALLNLIDDAKQPSVPQGIWDHLHGDFIDQRPYGDDPNFVTRHPRASNEMRTRLFHMVTDDAKRRKSAYALLGQIEEWRLDYGRPTGEPRHPDIDSGQPWPPKDPG